LGGSRGRRVRARSGLAIGYGKSRLLPGLETADQVCGMAEAQLLKGDRRQAGRVARLAKDDDALVGAGDGRVAVRACRV